MKAAFIAILFLCGCSTITSGHQLDFSKAIERVSPSVVTILITINGEPAGIGSGFAYRDSYIITNQHVVDGDKSVIEVEDHEGKKHKAAKVGENKDADIAVLKIDEQLKPVAIGKLSKLRPGQWVLAFGSPFGIGRTVSAGIISNTRRKLDISKIPLIQSDAAVNHGNSGGPMANAAGEVIGVNAYMYSPNGGAVGISFSIPITEAQAAADHIIMVSEKHVHPHP